MKFSYTVGFFRLGGFLAVFGDLEFSGKLIHKGMTRLGPSDHAAIIHPDIFITILVQKSGHVPCPMTGTSPYIDFSVGVLDLFGYGVHITARDMICPFDVERVKFGIGPHIDQVCLFLAGHDILVDIVKLIDLDDLVGWNGGCKTLIDFLFLCPQRIVPCKGKTGRAHNKHRGKCDNKQLLHRHYLLKNDFWKCLDSLKTLYTSFPGSSYNINNAGEYTQ